MRGRLFRHIVTEETKRKISENRKGKGIGHIVSEETRKKISLGNTGKIRSLEAREKYSKLRKGKKQSPERAAQSRLALEKARINITVDTYKKISESHKGEKNQWFGKTFSKEHKDKISKGNKGKVRTEEAKRKYSERQLGEKNHNFGKTTSDKQKEWARKMCSEKSGEKNHFWKGGITPIRNRVRESTKYNEWRKAIYKRDGYACVCCESTHELNAHHVKSFSILMKEATKLSPLLDGFEAAMIYEPLWDISNGITLCGDCHEKIHGRLNYRVPKLHVA